MPGLLASCVVNHCSQAIDILNHESVPLALDDADTGEAIEFAGDTLPTSADAAGDFNMRGGWRDLCAPPFPRCQIGYSQDLGLDPMVHGERAELINTVVQCTNGPNELA